MLVSDMWIVLNEKDWHEWSFKKLMIHRLTNFKAQIMSSWHERSEYAVSTSCGWL